MYSLGNKKRHLNFLGHKNYHLNNIGNKMHDKAMKTPSLKTTEDGLIQNYSNHANSIYEPIKGVEIKTSKSKFIVEKQPKKNNFGPQNYV